MPDPTYLAWKSMNYPTPESVVSTTTAISSPGSSASATAGTRMSTVHTATSLHRSPSSVKTKQSSEEVLSELLTLPQPLKKALEKSKDTGKKSAKE